jgi:hypothetical protein
MPPKMKAVVKLPSAEGEKKVGLRFGESSSPYWTGLYLLAVLPSEREMHDLVLGEETCLHIFGDCCDFQDDGAV